MKKSRRQGGACDDSVRETVTSDTAYTLAIRRMDRAAAQAAKHRATKYLPGQRIFPFMAGIEATPNT